MATATRQQIDIANPESPSHVDPSTIIHTVVTVAEFERLKSVDFAGHEWLSDDHFVCCDRKFGWTGDIHVQTVAGSGCARTSYGYAPQPITDHSVLVIEDLRIQDYD